MSRPDRYRCLLRTYYVSGMLLGPGDRMLRKTDMVSALKEITVQGKRQKVGNETEL